MAAHDLVLVISGMEKVLSAGDTVFRLEVPEFRLRRGGFYGLAGRSGSGKSTMLDLLAMVTRPSRIDTHTLFVPGRDGLISEIDVTRDVGTDETAGSRRLSSDDFVSGLRRDHFGYVLQSGGLFPYLSVRDNLELPFRMSGRLFSPRAIVERAERLGIADQLDKKPSGLSGGQRQRVSILRALVTNPTLLLADEPTAAVDENLAEVIMGELRAMANEQGTTVLVVSHDVELIEKFADEMVLLSPAREGKHGAHSVCRLV